MPTVLNSRDRRLAIGLAFSDTLGLLNWHTLKLLHWWQRLKTVYASATLPVCVRFNQLRLWTQSVVPYTRWETRVSFQTN